MIYSLCLLLFGIGLYCALVKKNMVKIVLGIMIMEYAVNLFLIMLGFRADDVAPIIDSSSIDSVSGMVKSSFVMVLQAGTASSSRNFFDSECPPHFAGLFTYSMCGSTRYYNEKYFFILSE